MILAVTDDHCPRSINLRLQDENILSLIISPPFISWSMSMKRDFCQYCLSSNRVWWWKSGSTFTPFHLSNFKIMSWLSSIIQKSPIRFFVLLLWTHRWKWVWCVSIHYRRYQYWCPQMLCLSSLSHPSQSLSSATSFKHFPSSQPNLIFLSFRHYSTLKHRGGAFHILPYIMADSCRHGYKL